MRKLGLHTTLYGVLLLAILGLVPLDSSFSSDAGAYGGQVHALRDGGWALSRPVAVVDEVNEGWLNTSITPDGPTPYTANPAYSLLLTGAVALVHGPAGADEGAQSAGALATGLHLVPVLGALGAAVVAWHLASRWDRRAAPLAFWLLALGPVLVNATTLWAHTLSTALGGAALLFVLRAADVAREGASGRWYLVANAAAATVALSGCALVRTEALFWIAAVVVAALIARRDSIDAFAAIAAGTISSIVWYGARAAGEGLRAERLPIETSVEALSASTGWLDSRIPATWRLLMTTLTPGPGALLTVLALALATLGALRLRRADGPDRSAVAILAAAALVYGIRLIAVPDVPISGVLGAWPLIVVLPLAGRAPRASDPIRSRDGEGDRPEPASSALPSLQPLVAACGVLLVAVVVTQHAASGGLQWGGRYLSTAFVPLAVIAAVRGVAVFDRHRLPLTALLVLPALAGVTASYRLQVTHRAIVDQAVAIPAEVVVTELPALPRIAWSELPTAFYRATDDDLAPLLDQLAANGVATVNIHGLSSAPVDGVAGYRQTAVADGLRHLELTGTQAGAEAATPSP